MTSRKLDGYEVDAVRGTLDAQGAKPERAVLYVRASGRPLPVEEDTVEKKGNPNGEDHIVFSKWGERVRPMAPDATITLGPVSFDLTRVRRGDPTGRADVPG